MKRLGTFLILTPVGIEGCFEELGALLYAGVTDAAAREAVSEKHVVFYPDPLPLHSWQDRNGR